MFRSAHLILAAMIVLGLAAGCDEFNSRTAGKSKGSSKEDKGVEAIRKIMKLDAELNPAQRPEFRKGSIEEACDALHKYVAGMQHAEGLLLSECPADFQAVYRLHMQAWNALAGFLQTQRWRGNIPKSMRGMAAELTGKEELKREIGRLGKEQKTADAELRKVAAKYGVQVPAHIAEKDPTDQEIFEATKRTLAELHEMRKKQSEAAEKK